MRRSPVRILIGLVAAGACTAGALGEMASMKYRGYRTWGFELPAESFARVSGGFTIGDVRFATELDGTTLVVDTDGDGEVDRRIEPRVDDLGIATARVTLKSGPMKYAVRLLDRGHGWTWSVGGAVKGNLRGMPIQIIDQNLNGRYDDYGADAMIVGKRRVASYLSQVVNVGGDLFRLDVAPDGSSVSFEPYTGTAGTLDMTTGMRTDARLLSAVVRSLDGDYSFDLAATPGRTLVPAGEYEIVTGTLGLGKQTVRVGKGRAETIGVTPDGTAELAWGGPVDAEFEYVRSGEEVVFAPDLIWYYGAAGEQYYNWHPIGKSPKFTLKEPETGAVLEVLILPGSC